MNTTVEDIKEYVLKEYGIDFKLNYIGTHRYLEYVNKNKTYEFSCDYAQSNLNDPYVDYWSIYEDFFDYKNWYGSGSARVDNGTVTIDEIMKEWGFKKDKQLNIFDLEVSDE